MTNSAHEENQPPEFQRISTKKLKALRQKAQQADKPQLIEVLSATTPAVAKPRHFGLLAAFVALVILPTALTAFYLFTIATDQYHSITGFTVRQNDETSPIELLGGLTSLSGSTTSDADILYEYIRSQEMVERVDAQLDLRRIYQTPEDDPVFAFAAGQPVENLLNYWQRMVRVFYNTGTGLIEIEALAFAPQDATEITQAIFEESSRMINEISDIAGEDILRHAREERDLSLERLKDARQVVTDFRARTQIVDPSADIQGQMGLLNTLQAQLAESLIDLDILKETTRTDDSRLDQGQRRIDVIRARIAEERKKLGVGEAGSDGYATLVSEYERLIVDREFAETAYISSLAGYDAAQADARQQSRYLAAYIKPTKAQTSQYPQRYLITALVAGFALLVWAILSLVYYSVRDRR